MAITGRRPATKPADAAISASVLTASTPLAAPEQRRRRNFWAWLAAALLHAAAIALLLIFADQAQPTGDQVGPTGVSLVYAAGSQTTETPRQGSATTAAQSAAAPAPPPPAAPRTPAPAQPNVNLDMPEESLAMAPLPLPVMPQAPAISQRPPHPAYHPPRPKPPQKYTVMNNMSFGNGTSTVPFASRGLNLSPPQTDAQAATAQNLSIQGDIGADWEAGFRKWVYSRLYYPDAAVAQNQQGSVTVTFTAHRDGHVTGIHMVNGSGSPFLDQAWFNIFAKNRLPPFPPGGSDSHQITATVLYQLTQ